MTQVGCATRAPARRALSGAAGRIHAMGDPWLNLSIILRGAYRDVMPWGSTVRRAGDWYVRLPRTAHQLEVVDGPVWSLFVTGPKVREWGFHCPRGWRHWRDFCAPGDSSKVGRGCE